MSLCCEEISFILYVKILSALAACFSATERGEVNIEAPTLPVLINKEYNPAA